MKDYIEVLKIISSSLPEDITWVVTGSTAFALQGIPVEPNDIDIQSNQTDIYTIEDALQKYIVEPVKYKESESIRSHFGSCEIKGIQVELMGGLQKKLDNGEWEGTVNMQPLINWISNNSLLIPVLDLEYEYDAYKILGREERASLLKEYI